MKDLFTVADEKLISDAISHAEMNTSGEIRVHIEPKCNYDLMDRAADVFAELNMHKTKQRNGVLFYLAIKNKQFAVLGDGGINAVVPSGFWDQVKNILEENFKKGKFADGLSKGIMLAGEQLKSHFPYNIDDKNELSNEISFGK